MLSVDDEIAPNMKKDVAGFYSWPPFAASAVSLRHVLFSPFSKFPKKTHGGNAA